MHRMTVSLSPLGVRLAVEASSNPVLPATGLPIERKESDDCTFLTILAEEGGADE